MRQVESKNKKEVRDDTLTTLNDNFTLRYYKDGYQVGAPEFLPKVTDVQTYGDKVVKVIFADGTFTKAVKDDEDDFLTAGIAICYLKKMLASDDIKYCTNAFNKVISNSVNLILENDANILLKKGSDSNIEQNVTINDNISAPIKKGDCLGKVTYTQNNEQLLEVNLLAESDVEKNTVWNLTTSLYQRWFNMLR